MKILRLTAENIKRLTAVEITPDGNLVQITGRNAQGKSSVLDAIWFALAGTKNIPTQPIRKGETTARIQLDLGELVITRRFRLADDGETTTTIVVENADGARFGSPQKVLDGLLGALTFDPLAFSRLPAKAQVDALKGLVPGIPFAEVEAANRKDYEARTDVNRRAKERRAQALAICVADGPTEPVNEAELIAELERAGETNLEIQRQQSERERVAVNVANLRRAADEAAANAVDLAQQAKSWAAQAASDVKRANDMEADLQRAGTPPEPISTADLRCKIDEARRTNVAVQARIRKADLSTEAVALEAKSKALTDGMEARSDALRRTIAEAKMPIPGLGIEGDCVTLNGLPLDQASDAERLRASVAIAMAANPKLRVIRVRDGSLLDEDGMKLLAQMAEESGFQVWLEAVTKGEKIGFVIEDGSVKSFAEEANQ